MNYITIPQFDKDLKKLIKKYRTLNEDIETAKKSAIELFHLKDLDNNSVFLIPSFDLQNIQIYKLKKFASKSFKGRGVQSGIRIIYAFHKDIMKVVFLEIYHKSDKLNEDKDRIRRYLDDLNNLL